jgi:hypothetical protein
MTRKAREATELKSMALLQEINRKSVVLRPWKGRPKFRQSNRKRSKPKKS